jgi:hypothetical protein
LVSHRVCTGHPHFKTWLPELVCLGTHVKSGIPARSSNMRCIYPLHLDTLVNLKDTLNELYALNSQICQDFIRAVVGQYEYLLQISNTQYMGVLAYLFI